MNNLDSLEVISFEGSAICNSKFFSVDIGICFSAWFFCMLKGIDSITKNFSPIFMLLA